MANVPESKSTTSEIPLETIESKVEDDGEKEKEKPEDEEGGGGEGEKGDAEIEYLYPDWESQRSVKPLEKVDDEARDRWKSSAEFIMSCISSAVGLGNVWRFPFVCYANGGAAFLIPYLIILLLVARPLYLIEVASGQFCSRGPTGIWEMVPLLKGTGWAMWALACVTVIWYVNILQFCGAYLAFGMASELPWQTCNKEAYLIDGKLPPFLKKEEFECVTNYTIKNQSGSDPAQWSYGKFKHPENHTYGNAELYYFYGVTQQLENLDNGIGTPILHLWLSLLVIWILIFLSNALGTKSSGKAAYFTAIFPYVVLICLLGRSLSLDGARKGVDYFFIPDWEKLKDGNVWFNALNQCFFSLGIGYGQLVSFGSYNDFRQPIYRDVLIVGGMDSFTSVLAGVTVFSILGVLAEHKNTTVDKVAAGNGGAALAFISYPEVLSRFGPYPAPQIFSFLFFFMLVVLGVGSATAFLHTVTITILDKIPKLTEKKWYKTCLVAGICFLFFLLGLPMTTPGANFILDLLDTYSGALSCYFIVLLEITGIAYVYGMKSYMKDLDFMTDAKTARWKKLHQICVMFMVICGYILPVFLAGILIYVIYDFQAPTHKVNGNNIRFPDSALVCGFLLMFGIISPIPIFWFYIYFTRKTRSWYKKWMAARTPSRIWGPKDPSNRKQWIEYKRGWDDRFWLYKQTISKWCPDKLHLIKSRDPKGDTEEPPAQLETESGPVQDGDLVGINSSDGSASGSKIETQVQNSEKQLKTE